MSAAVGPEVPERGHVGISTEDSAWRATRWVALSQSQPSVGEPSLAFTLRSRAANPRTVRGPIPAGCPP
jgi:hypothetical protein